MSTKKYTLGFASFTAFVFAVAAAISGALVQDDIGVPVAMGFGIVGALFALACSAVN